jgi:hypothetical protein
MLIIDIDIDTIIQNVNVNPAATKCLLKVAWDSYLVPDRRVSFRLTDYLELLRGSTYISSKTSVLDGRFGWVLELVYTQPVIIKAKSNPNY